MNAKQHVCRDFRPDETCGYVCVECGAFLVDDDEDEDYEDDVTCPVCYGTGFLEENVGDCDYCDGEGYLWWR